MIRQLDRVMSKWVGWSLARERQLVEHPSRERRRVVQSLSWFVAVLLAFNAWAWTDGWLHTGTVVAVGFYLGTTALAGLARARAYRNGWLDGRVAMIVSMSEAQRRGLSMYEWLEREAERDAATLGLPSSWATALHDHEHEEDL